MQYCKQFESIDTEVYRIAWNVSSHIPVIFSVLLTVNNQTQENIQIISNNDGLFRVGTFGGV